MKKLMTALTVCAVASYAIAATNVVSQNIVGYNNSTINGWSMHSVAFDAVGGDGFIANVNLKGAFTAGDTLQIWNGSDYDPIMFGDIYDEGLLNIIGQGWLDPENGYWPWTNTIPQGVGFWVNTQSSTPVTFVGQVPASGTVVANLVQGWNLIGVGFPIDVVLNNAVWTGVATGDVADGWDGNDYVPVSYGDIYDEALLNIIGQGWLDPNNGYWAMTAPLSGTSSGFWVNIAAVSGTASFTLNY